VHVEKNAAARMLAAAAASQAANVAGAARANRQIVRLVRTSHKILAAEDTECTEKQEVDTQSLAI